MVRVKKEYPPNPAPFPLFIIISSPWTGEDKGEGEGKRIPPHPASPTEERGKKHSLTIKISEDRRKFEKNEFYGII